MSTEDIPPKSPEDSLPNTQPVSDEGFFPGCAQPPLPSQSSQPAHPAQPAQLAHPAQPAQLAQPTPEHTLLICLLQRKLNAQTRRLRKQRRELRDARDQLRAMGEQLADIRQRHAVAMRQQTVAHMHHTARLKDDALLAEIRALRAELLSATH